MTEPARIEALGDGRFRVAGALGFDTVPALLQASDSVLSGAGPWRIDLAGVAQVDSAGLALLLRWMRRASAAGTRAQYENMPHQMRAIAAASGLEQLLGEA